MYTALRQLKEQFPDVYPNVHTDERYAHYSVLNHFGVYSAEHFAEEKAKEILIAINRIYQQKNLFTCNAIENEFLSAIATQLGVKDVTHHLDNIPENLWAVYIKVLIETQKNIRP